jgi:hypothetical protein
MPSNYTGVAWSPEFSTHDRGPGAAFLPRPTFLPDERWDRGQRVECLYDILKHVRSQLTSGDLDEINQALAQLGTGALQR